MTVLANNIQVGLSNRFAQLWDLVSVCPHSGQRDNLMNLKLYRIYTV